MPKISLSLAFAIAFLFVLTKGSDDEQEYDFGSAETADNQLATETVVEFLAKLGTLSAATADVGAFMDRISLSAFAFLKLGYPVGALIAGALHISTKTETEEYKALVKLRDSMEKNFEEMKRMISVAKNVINMKIGLKDYINNVHVPLADFRIQMDVFWDPAVEKDAEDVQEFKKSCSLMRLKDSVLEVFNYIFTHTVENCKNGLSQKQIALLGNFVPLLRSFRMKMDNEIERGLFDKKMADLSIWFTELDNKLAKKVLEKMQELSNNTSSFDSANYALNVLQSFRDDYRSEARPNQ